MPLWKSGRSQPVIVGASRTFQLETQASTAFYAKDWPTAERLYRDVLEKGDLDSRVVARNMLGRVYERQQRVQDAIALYEANVSERSSLSLAVSKARHHLPQT